MKDLSQLIKTIFFQFLVYSRGDLDSYNDRVGRRHSKEGSSMSVEKNYMPLVDLPDEGVLPSKETALQVVNALKQSGFLLVKSTHVPLDLQQAALSAAASLLLEEGAITHPTDPKKYMMLESTTGLTQSSLSATIDSYWQGLEQTKVILLQCIAMGLDLPDENFLVRLHQQNNSCMRLIHYFPGTDQTGNRCKEHSDYGSITLLLTDGVSGLEAFLVDENMWIAVPHVPGALVVNIGTLLSDWTQQTLSATLHRVAGPASLHSKTPRETLLQAVLRPRTSIAFFADPDPEVSLVLQQQTTLHDDENTKTVAEYIQWRSGGTGADRSGIAFSKDEKERVLESNKTHQDES